MALKSAADLALQMQRVGNTFSQAEVDKRLTTLGMKLKPIGLEVATSILGADAGFTGGPQRGSGWHSKGGGAIPLKIAFKVKPYQLVMMRDGKSVGPWRVAESGRKAYKAGDQRSRGFRTRKKTGERFERFATVKGTVGATKGFGAWTKAEAQMEREAKKTMANLTRAAVIKAFR